MRREMNVMAMAKGGERYVFLYDDQSYDALIRVFGKFAQSPELNFSVADAALLGRKVRESAAQQFRHRFPTCRDV